MRAVGGVGDSGVDGRPSGSLPPTTDWGELCGRWVFCGVGGFGCPAGLMPPTTDWGLFGWRVVFFDL